MRFLTECDSLGYFFAHSTACVRTPTLALLLLWPPRRSPRNLARRSHATFPGSSGDGQPWRWSLCAWPLLSQQSLRPAQLSAILALVCAGAFARIATPVPHVVIPPPEFLEAIYSEDKVEIVAHVTNDGALLAGDGPRERFEMETESIEAGGSKFLQPVSIRATVYPSPLEARTAKADVPALARAYGERIHLLAKLRLPRNFGNPGRFRLRRLSSRSWHQHAGIGESRRN